LSGWLNLDPAEIRVFKIEFYDFEAPGRNKSTAGEEAASPPACSMGTYIGLHGRKTPFKKNRIWLWSRFYDYRSWYLNMILKIEYKKIKVAHGLMKNITGHLVKDALAWNESTL